MTAQETAIVESFRYDASVSDPWSLRARIRIDFATVVSDSQTIRLYNLLTRVRTGLVAN